MTSRHVPTRPTPTSTDDSCIVFLHIPKTAGMTLGTVLRWNFRRAERIHLNTLDRPLDRELAKFPPERLSRARLLSGHMPYGAHRHVPRPSEYVTVLRDPVERVVSVYKHILKTPTHVLHDRVVDGGVSLEQYIQSGMDEGQTENSQTRQMSGRQFDVVDATALDEAKRHLETFLVVGLTERFEETIALLRRAIGLRMPLYITKNTSFPLEVSGKAIDLIAERNELDNELYNFALGLFRAQVGRQRRSFDFEVSMFEAWRPAAGAIGQATNRAAGVLSRSPATKRLVRRVRDYVNQRH